MFLQNECNFSNDLTSELSKIQKFVQRCSHLQVIESRCFRSAIAICGKSQRYFLHHRYALLFSTLNFVFIQMNVKMRLVLALFLLVCSPNVLLEKALFQVTLLLESTLYITFCSSLETNKICKILFRLYYNYNSVPIHPLWL